ncbi:MAG: glycosyl hydrolase family 18 protein [Terracidiphilus sp.]
MECCKEISEHQLPGSLVRGRVNANLRLGSGVHDFFNAGDKPDMRHTVLCPLIFLALSLSSASAQGTAPTFEYRAAHSSYRLAGGDPAQGGATVIPTVLVPVTLSFEARRIDGKPTVIKGSTDVPRILRSPMFAKFPFGQAGDTQYVDAMLRTTFPAAKGWHTLLGKPLVEPVKITVPTGYGYVLSSKKTGTLLAMVDVEFLQREIFKQIPRQDGKLVIVVTHDTAYYAYGDATVCCSWGTHGIDSATGNSFVLASYLRDAPSIVGDMDVQPLTEQLAEFLMDPLHDPLFHPVFHGPAGPGNAVPAWMRPPAAGSTNRSCGGTGIAARYTLMEPTDTNPRSVLQVSKPWTLTSEGTSWHVQNVALLPWYLGAAEGLGNTYSFPNPQALPSPATPCPHFQRAGLGAARPQASTGPAVEAVPLQGPPNGHELIGYWTGRGPQNSIFPLRDVSPQWDIVIVAFAAPDLSAPEGNLWLQVRPGLDLAQLKDDVAWLKGRGKKVMISLGGGAKYFTLNDPKSIPNFVSSVSRIVSEYGFDGIDLDFETPSLALDPRDTDFRRPTTPSIVNLISALRQLHEHFGPGFMISLVPEGTQVSAGYVSYGGQFGSYLPLAWGIRDILSFVDVQEYNTPPLEGLDGEIYQLGSADYDVAMTELLLHGFHVGGDKRRYFPPLPAHKVAVGFLVGATTPALVSESMDSIIAGKLPPGAHYKLRKPGGYHGMIGAMFWTIDADRFENLSFSNKVGPQLHAYPAVK